MGDTEQTVESIMNKIAEPPPAFATIPAVAPELRGALKLKPAAIYLGGLSKPTMLRLVKRGLLRPNRVTRHLIFPIKELDRFLESASEPLRK
jgi:hypothetical protein